MNKLEEYNKKIEVLKRFLAADGSIEALVKAQNEILGPSASDNKSRSTETEPKKDK